MTAVEPKPADRSLSQLVSSMTDDVTTLLRKEVELAKEELRAEGQKATKVAAGFGAAAGVGHYAGFALVITLGLLLDLLLPMWAAFLIVTVVLGAVAAALAQRARSQLPSLNPAPEQTIETLKEDVQWLKEQKS